MPRRGPAKPYKGILKVPMPKYDPALSPSDNAWVALAETGKKLMALMDHYGVKRGDWHILALALAQDHIPAFAIQSSKPPQGRSPQLMGEDFVLWLELGTAESVNERAGHLTKSHPYFKGKKPSVLRARYYKLMNAKSPEGQRLRRLIGEFVSRGTLEGFISRYFASPKRKLKH